MKTFNYKLSSKKRLVNLCFSHSENINPINQREKCPNTDQIRKNSLFEHFSRSAK